MAEEEEVKEKEEKKERGKGAVVFAVMFGPPVIFFSLVILFGGPRSKSHKEPSVTGPLTPPPVKNWDKLCSVMDELVSRTHRLAIQAQENGNQWGWEKMGEEFEKAAKRLEKAVNQIKSSAQFDYHALWDVAKELRKYAHAPYKEYQTQKAMGKDPNRGLLKAALLYTRAAMQIYSYMVKSLETLGQIREGSKQWDFEQDYKETCDFYQTLNRE